MRGVGFSGCPWMENTVNVFRTSSAEIIAGNCGFLGYRWITIWNFPGLVREGDLWEWGYGGGRGKGCSWNDILVDKLISNEKRQSHC